MGHRKTIHTAEDRRLGASAGQTYLPIFDTVVFFDWFGTLSTSRFWDGITQARRHALRRPLTVRLQELFTLEKQRVTLWMHGELTDAEIVNSLNIALPRHYREDYLHRALHRDCRASDMRPGMATLIRALRDQTFVAVATDNMDCFVTAAPRVLSNEAPVDAILSSSERRVLKAEDPERFFAPVLQATGFAWSDAVLIDDCERTCAAFRQLGGRAYHFTTVQRLLSELRRDPLPAVRLAAKHASSTFATPAEQLSLFAGPAG
jgi:FMN phosphatase YigB (HAD superfamily)